LVEKQESFNDHTKETHAMTKQNKIPASDEAWDSGELGRDEEFAKPAEDDIENAIDESLELQMISIRLQKSLIESFKQIASINGIGYQPLMRQILKRFVDCEMKRILGEKAADHAKAKAEEQESTPRRRVAG
jgi:predicted DNA binding CopG/RHH family protein